MAIKDIYVNYDFNANKVTGLADGTTSTDAINKGQLDAQNTALTNYIDNKILGLGAFVGEADPGNGIPTAGSGEAGAIDKGDWWHFTGEGTLLGVSVHKGDRLQAMVDDPDTTTNTAANTDWKILHTYHEADGRYSIDNISLVANTANTITHGLGYKFVQVTVADADGKRIDVEVDYVDENTLTLTANQNVTVYGVVSI